MDRCCMHFQDSPPEWEYESKMMSAVYSNAYCIIAAGLQQNQMIAFSEKGIRKTFCRGLWKPTPSKAIFPYAVLSS